MEGNNDILKILQNLEQKMSNLEEEMKKEMSNLKEEMSNLKKGMSNLKEEIESLEWKMNLLDVSFKAIVSVSSSDTNEKEDWIDMTLYPQSTGRGFNNTERVWKKFRW